ncbi:MAG: histone deacetylase [Patescibacteria group bacterium]|nr:histone deacetylase [Patescibacteria group bacterium]
MTVIYSSKFLDFGEVGHPESPQRLELIYHELRDVGLFHFETPSAATLSDLLRVHNMSLVEQVKRNEFYNPDTPNIENIYSFALLSAGAALKAISLLEDGREKRFTYALARPPGHHATRKELGGFCYFNNIAVASARLLADGKKVAILDIDVHHGNGTEDIFRGKKNIIYVSLHQSPLYPGTGLAQHDNCFNFPLPPGTSMDSYVKALSFGLRQIKKFSPDILGVSLGFDTYAQDPLAEMRLYRSDYRIVAGMIKRLLLPTFFVQEGGYSQDIGKLARTFFSELI